MKFISFILIIVLLATSCVQKQKNSNNFKSQNLNHQDSTSVKLKIEKTKKPKLLIKTFGLSLKQIKSKLGNNYELIDIKDKNSIEIDDLSTCFIECLETKNISRKNIQEKKLSFKHHLNKENIIIREWELNDIKDFELIYGMIGDIYTDSYDDSCETFKEPFKKYSNSKTLSIVIISVCCHYYQNLLDDFVKKIEGSPSNR